MQPTVAQVLKETVEKYGTQKAYSYRDPHLGEWQSVTWQGFYQDVCFLARGLISLGLEPQNVVTIMGPNSYRWVLAHVATILAGGIPAGIYPTSSPEQWKFLQDHSRATFGFIQNKELLLRMRGQGPLPSCLKMSILMEPAPPSESFFLNFNEVYKKGEKVSATVLNERTSKSRPEDIASLVYTSGTTAHPKAVMLTQENITWMASRATEEGFRLTTKDRFISYLPLSHIAEQMVALHGPMRSGTHVYFAPSLSELPSMLKFVQPTVFFGVPRVWEKINTEIEYSLSRNPMASFLFRRAQKNHRHSPTSFVNRLCEKTIFYRIKKELGLNHCRLCLSGAAPIARSTLDFFSVIGLPLYELYGLSEATGPSTLSLPHEFRLGSVGKPLRGTELQIADDGEILIRGPHIFKGYLHDEEATRQSFDAQGWLHTGDLGVFDEDGYLYLTGRKKNLIITSGGENIAPEMIEGEMKRITVIEHCLVVGERRKYLSMLLTLNSRESLRVSQSLGLDCPNLESLSQHPQFQRYLQKEIDKVNESFARVQTIKAFKILPQSFSEEEGELTPTLKVKRSVVLNRYSGEIERLYA